VSDGRGLKALVNIRPYPGVQVGWRLAGKLTGMDNDMTNNIANLKGLK
jgi:hypothetical protein